MKAVAEFAAQREKTKDRRVVLPDRLVTGELQDRPRVIDEVRSWLKERRMRPRLVFVRTERTTYYGDPIYHYELNFSRMEQAFEFKLRWK